MEGIGQPADEGNTIKGSPQRCKDQRNSRLMLVLEDFSKSIFTLQVSLLHDRATVLVTLHCYHKISNKST
jgi:hypothetical protein